MISSTQNGREEAIPAPLLAQVHLGSWRWDIEPDIVYWSAELCRIFGFDPNLPSPSWREHPQLYSQASFKELESMVHRCLETGMPYALSLDAFRRDGTPIFLEGHGAASRNPEGDITFLYGVTLDRTTERRALLESQKNLRNYQAMFEQAAVGVLLRDSQSGRILLVNQRFAKMLGVPASRLTGRAFSSLLHGSYVPSSGLHRIDCFVMGMSTPSEMVFQHNSGEPVWGEVTVSLMESSREPSVEIVFVQDISQRKESERARQQAELATGIALLKERQEIAQYMHDGTGQLLAGIALYAAGVLDSPGIPDVHKSKIAEIEAMAVEVMRRLRAVSQGLVPISVRADTFEESLRNLSKNFSTGFGVGCEWEGACDWRPGSDLQALNLYLIAQEAMLNAVRHGRAKTIKISLHTSGDAVILQIHDNGSGFSPPKNQQGFGLFSMKHRAIQCGGELHISNHPSGGTLVGCHIPK